MLSDFRPDFPFVYWLLSLQSVISCSQVPARLGFRAVVSGVASLCVGAGGEP